MTVKVIIPVYKFTKILDDIVNFYLTYLEEDTIIVVNDSIFDAVQVIDRPNVYLFNSLVNNDLRYTYSHYNSVVVPTDVTITNEHDVLPNESALYAMIHMYNLMKDKMELASVSCMYAWRGTMCYPSHLNWHLDKKLDYKGEIGKVTRIGKQGVPFGFTLWNSDALNLVDNPLLPRGWKLDSFFGKLLDTHGYEHLRLVDYSVEHYKKGVRTWKG